MNNNFVKILFIFCGMGYKLLDWSGASVRLGYIPLN
nr:MAG TPA: hypothetical protein [Caudoviricetes sp.]